MGDADGDGVVGGGAVIGGPGDALRRCPLTRAPMRDPVVAADGVWYERKSIARASLEKSRACESTRRLYD